MTSLRIAHISTIDLTLRFILFGQLRRLSDEGFEVATISAVGPWVSNIEAEGIRHIPWANATRAWDPASDARAFFELLRILGKERFDLVHTHTPKAGVMGRVAARLAGIPCVVSSIHGFYARPEDRLAKRLAVLGLERIATWFSDLELYDSKEDLAWARRIGLVNRANSRFLSNGVDLSYFDATAVPPERLRALRRDLGIQDGTLVVGTVGRLVAEKGYREFFAAARRIHATMPDIRFVALGSPDRDKADAIRDDEIEAAQEHVIFPGWIEDVRDHLALMDIFVLPSWREGQPISVIQAAAMGKPLVVTDIRGCREVVRDNVEGLLVPPRNAERLASAILRALRDEEFRERAGRAARSRALEQFDENKIMEALIAEYNKVLAKKGIVRQRQEPTGDARVRSARSSDAATLARIHREALPEGFLSALGDRFLRRLYLALARDPEAVALVAEDGNGIVGFATGVPSVRHFYRRFYVRHGLAAAVAAAPRFLERGMIRRVRETAVYPSASGSLPDSELLSIAVAQEWRSKGVGKLLARGIIDGLAQRGASEIKVVVGADNEEANRFYERIGFQYRAKFSVHDGTPSNVLVFQCHS